MLADFTVTIHEARKPLAVRIKIYDNVAALRSAATQYDNRFRSRKKKRRGEFHNVLGICHRMRMASDPVCAIVRLAPPNLGIGIVSHELTHAAVQMWEIHNKFDETPLTCENDEWFCWVLGELVRCTVNKLYEKGVWTE